MLSIHQILKFLLLLMKGASPNKCRTPVLTSLAIKGTTRPSGKECSLITLNDTLV